MGRIILCLYLMVMWIEPSSQVIEYPLIDSVPANADICKSGYYWDELQGDNCCSYHQCNDDYTLAFQRFCAPPLVWNMNDSTCDWQETVWWCPVEDESCWAPPDVIRQAPPNCTANLTENQCCQIGKYDEVEEGSGLLFTKINETFYIYHHDRDPQECPYNGTFNLETCCCESHVYALPSCWQWDFDLTLYDERQNLPMAEGGCRFFRHGATTRGTNPGVPRQLPGYSLECLNDGRPAELNYFSNAWWGDQFAMAIWFKCIDDCGDGVVYTNGHEATEFISEINPTLQLTVDPVNNRATFLIADKYSVKTYMKTVDLVVDAYQWNFFLFQMKETNIWCFWGTEDGFESSFDDTALLDTDFRFVSEGNKCPLKIGAFRGLVDQILVCPTPFTYEWVRKWSRNPNLYPEPHYSWVWRQLKGIQLVETTTSTTTTTTSTTTARPRRRGRKRRRASKNKRNELADD